MKKFRNYMSYDRALEKAMRYCSYQERCLDDMERRFLAWNVEKSDWNKIIDYLMKEDFLNEERYIEAYVRGKFSMKKWGRNKIVVGLMKKKIYGDKVNVALNNEIEEEEYRFVLTNLIEKKNSLINESDALKRRDKIYRYLIGKGYESDLIVEQLQGFE